MRVVRHRDEWEPVREGFDVLLGGLDHPVFVVTAAAGPERAGSLVEYATRTSVDPPRMLVCLPRRAAVTRVARRAEWLGVHVLRAGDLELAHWFAESTAREGADKLLDLDWAPGPGGVPVLSGVDAFVGRVVSHVADVGDHVGHLLAPEGVISVDPERASRRQLGAREVARWRPDLQDPATETEPSPLAGVARDPASIITVVQSLRVGGFSAEFRTGVLGTVVCQACGRVSDAAEFSVHHLRRLEGASDPDELLVIAALECPRCRSRGTLVLTYGPTATDEDADVLERLPSHPRRPDPEQA